MSVRQAFASSESFQMAHRATEARIATALESSFVHWRLFRVVAGLLMAPLVSGCDSASRRNLSVAYATLKKHYAKWLPSPGRVELRRFADAVEAEEVEVDV